MPDISALVFVLSIMVVGALLTANIRRDFVRRRRLRKDFERQTHHLRARRRQAQERH